MAFRKIEAGLVHAPVDEFIGKTGTIFYDNDLGDFRISDGATPGGIALSFGGGNGGNYTLPTASATVKGGVKIDGSTITVANQVISVGTVPYSSISGKPTIPTNNNELTNGAEYITSSALTGLATESYVTNRGYITSSALTGYATESYVTNRGYITSSALTGLATETFVTTQGYITSAALSGYALTTAIPTDISDLTDNSGLLGQGGGGTTYITNNVENPYSFSIAGDDSTLREIANGESIKFTGAGGITVATDAEGNVTITGNGSGGSDRLVAGSNSVILDTGGTVTFPNGLLKIAGNTISNYVVNDLGGGSFLSAGSQLEVSGDKTVITNGTTNSLGGGSFLSAGSQLEVSGAKTVITSGTTSSDGPSLTSQYLVEVSTNGILNAFQVITMLDADSGLTSELITELDNNGFKIGQRVTNDLGGDSEPLVGFSGWTFGTVGQSQAITFPDATVQHTAWTGTYSWNDLTDKPNLAGTYSWTIEGDDSTLREINTGDIVKFIGAGGVTTASNADGNIVITAAPGIIVSATAPTDPLAKQWYNSVDGRTYVKYNDLWVDANPPVVPEVSTYLDGLVVEGTTITTADYNDTDIKIHDLTFTANGVIQLPEGGDIVDSTGTSVLGGGTADLGKFKIVDAGSSVGWTTTDDEDGYGGYGIFLSPDGEGYSYITIPNNEEAATGENLRIGATQANSAVRIETDGGNWTFDADGKLTLPNGSTIGDSDAVFGVPITTTRGTIFLGNQAECLGGENHFHIMKAGQQAIDLFLGDDNNYVKLPSTGGVEISSSEIGDQYYWTFGTDGNLTLPNGMTIDSYGTSGVNAFVNIGGDNTRISIDNDGAPPGFSITTNAAVTARTWRFGPDGELSFPDATVQTTAWLGVFSYNDLTDKPNLAGTYTWSIAADDSSQLEIGTGNLVKIQGAGGVTTALDADGNITVTGAPGIITSATAPTDTLAKQWYNSTDGRTYVKYNDLWVDANPPVVPEVSTYLDGLVVEGTTITTVDYNDTDIKINNLTFTANGVIQLPLGGDIVDSTGTSVLGGGTADLGKFVFDSDGDSAFISTTDDAGASPDRYDIVLIPDGEGYSSIRVPTQANTLAGDPVRISNMYENGSVAIETNSGTFSFSELGLSFPQGSSFGSPGAGEFSLFNPIDTDFAIYTNNGTNHNWLFGADGALTLPGDIRSEGNINIEVNLTDSTKQTWQFGEDGALTLPEGGRINAVGYNNIVRLGNDGFMVANGSLFNENENTWTLEGQASDSGTYITIPGKTDSENGLSMTISHQWENTSIDIQGAGGVWSFDSDGSLLIPGKIRVDEYITRSDLTAYDQTTGSGVPGGPNTLSIIQSDWPTANIDIPVGAGITSPTFNTATVTGPVIQGPTGTWIIPIGDTDATAFTSTIDITYIVGKTWQFDSNGNLTLPQGTLFGYTELGDFNIDGAVDKYISIHTHGGADSYGWTFGTDGGLTFPDATVQTTAWLGVFSYNDLADKPNLAGTYSWSIAADDSTLREINTSDSVKFTGAGGVTTSSDANGNITITAAPGIIVSATAPTDTLAKQWYNSTDGRTYVKYNDLWVDANPPVVPEVSTYLDGLVIEGTTITTASYDATDIKIHNLTFTDNGVIQLPLGGDIVDSTGASVLGAGGITFEYSRLQEGITSHPITSITGLNETGLSLTSNSWAQLMWVPDITTVTLNDIDDGGDTYNWAYTESGGFIVESKYQGTIKSWRFNRNGTTDFPNYTFPSADGAANQVLKTDGNGNLTWTSATVDLTGYATEEFVNNALASAGVTISPTAPTGLNNGALWYNSSTLELYVLYENQWVAASSSGGGSGDYNDLTNKPTNVSQFANDANYVSRDEVYAMILELGSTN